MLMRVGPLVELLLDGLKLLLSCLWPAVVVEGDWAGYWLIWADGAGLVWVNWILAYVNNNLSNPN